MTTYPLPQDTTAAGAARELAAAWAADAGWSDEQAADVLIVVSELAANAARHASPPFALTLAGDADTVLVTVTDHGGASTPRARVADPGEGHGRGLAMVERLSAATGWRRDGGRTEVWARVART